MESWWFYSAFVLQVGDGCGVASSNLSFSVPGGATGIPLLQKKHRLTGAMEARDVSPQIQHKFLSSSFPASFSFFLLLLLLFTLILIYVSFSFFLSLSSPSSSHWSSSSSSSFSVLLFSPTHCIFSSFFSFPLSFGCHSSSHSSSQASSLLPSPLLPFLLLLLLQSYFTVYVTLSLRIYFWLLVRWQWEEKEQTSFFYLRF